MLFVIHWYQKFRCSIFWCESIFLQKPWGQSNIHVRKNTPFRRYCIGWKQDLHEFVSQIFVYDSWHQMGFQGDTKGRELSWLHDRLKEVGRSREHGKISFPTKSLGVPWPGQIATGSWAGTCCLKTLPATSPYSDVLRYSNLMDVICSSLDQDDEITRSLDPTEVVEDKWQLVFLMFFWRISRFTFPETNSKSTWKLTVRRRSCPCWVSGNFHGPSSFREGSRDKASRPPRLLGQALRQDPADSCAICIKLSF